MSVLRTSARRLVAVLLLSLLAALAPVAGSVAAEATLGSDAVSAVTAAQSALPVRLTPGGQPFETGTGPAGHPGPVLDVMLLAPPEALVAAPIDSAVDRSATAGLDPGNGSAGDLRGPPTS